MHSLDLTWPWSLFAHWPPLETKQLGVLGEQLVCEFLCGFPRSTPAACNDGRVNNLSAKKALAHVLEPRARHCEHVPPHGKIPEPAELFADFNELFCDRVISIAVSFCTTPHAAVMVVTRAANATSSGFVCKLFVVFNPQESEIQNRVP